MAVAVIFGLAFATVLTLVLVPTLYVTLSRAAVWVGRTSRWLRAALWSSPATEPEPQPAIADEQE